jgi:3',5'-nucleoside bisphosphate phosphatase
LIDLHTHTTASDGRCTPTALVARAAAAGVTVLSVTDHDTVAGCGEAAQACAAAGVAFVPGIEITAVADGIDVHVLGYFIDVSFSPLQEFLLAQRRTRVDRCRSMVARLAALGMPLDADAILRPALDDPSKAVGRPWVARAMVEAGHARDLPDAFDRWLATGRPGFVPRVGAAPAAVFGWIHRAGGVASLAHPGLLNRDQWIPRFADEGLDALEVYHTKHDGGTTGRYLAMAGTLGLAVSGGSDYHEEAVHGQNGLGRVFLPPAEFDRLRARRPTISAGDVAAAPTGDRRAEWDRH